MSREFFRVHRNELIDGALAMLMLALSLSIVTGVAQRSGADMRAAYWLAVAHSAPVAIRRSAPRTAFFVSIAAGFWYIALGNDTVGLGVTMLLMMFTLAAETPRRESLLGLAAAGTALVVAVELSGLRMQFDTLAGNLFVFAAAWLIGDSARRRRLQAVADARREAERAVVEERLRIARELHDVVAHSMSVVNVQAGMARLLVDDDPEGAKRSLRAIERSGHEALEEMRRLLQVLRSDNGAPAMRHPAPQLADIDALVDEARASGMKVRIESNRRRDLHPGLELTAYRVVQEALTNVRKHAPDAAVRINLSFSDDDLTIVVDSDLDEAPAQPAGGHGLTGMRERIELYAGDMVAGTTDGNTFSVKVRLPYDGVRL